MTFEPIDWPDEYEAAHDRQDGDDTPSPVARFKRYLAARKAARLGHRDIDTDDMCSCNEPRVVCELRTELDAANAECARATKRADLIDATLDAMRQQAIDAVKERNVANERAEKAEAEAGQHLGVNLGLLGGRDAAVKRARKAEAERDEARARLGKADLRAAKLRLVAASMLRTFTTGQDVHPGYAAKVSHPVPLADVERWQAVVRETSLAADAAQNGRSATETSELQFDASAPATKPEGAQRGAQGLCESERDDETGTER
jgi:hypothetical protein